MEASVVRRMGTPASALAASENLPWLMVREDKLGGMANLHGIELVGGTHIATTSAGRHPFGSVAKTPFSQR